MDIFSLNQIDKIRYSEKRYEAILRHRLAFFGINVDFDEIAHFGFVSDKK
jgi:translation elongation factor EF-1alpha